MTDQNLEFDPAAVDCKHKYEECIEALCSVICHSMPSEKGCAFNYLCDYDSYLCDGNCEKHQKEGKLQSKRAMLSSLQDARSKINSAIKQLEKELACMN